MDIQSVGNASSVAPQRTDKAAGSTDTSAVQTAAPVQTTEAIKQAGPVSAASLDDAVKNINKALQSLSRNIEFSVDTDSNRTVVKVVDQQTQQVLRQMPSPEALEIAKALDRVQGLLIKQQA